MDNAGIFRIYPLANVDITMERSTIFNGKTHNFDWAIFLKNSYVSHHQRVIYGKRWEVHGEMMGSEWGTARNGQVLPMKSCGDF